MEGLAGDSFSPRQGDTLNDFLLRCVESENGKPFIFIIDEWNAVISESEDDLEAHEAYLNLLRGWFLSTSKAVAAAYMTEILLIKKDGSQSAISGFTEFSVIKLHSFGLYVGFTEAEVRQLCDKHNIDFKTMKQWYDGYHFQNFGSIYNPYSVMESIENDDFDSCWAENSASEQLMDYISRDYNGLTKTVAELVGGVEVKVDTTRWFCRNDFSEL